MTAGPHNDDDLDLEMNDDLLLDEDLDTLDADGMDGDLNDGIDGDWEDAEEATPATKPKKKFSLFNIAVIGVAVLIGGGILVSMGGKSKNPNGAPNQEVASLPATPPGVDSDSVQTLQQDTDVSPQTPQAPAPVQQQPQGFMNDPTQLDQAQAPSLPSNPAMTGFANAPQAPGAAQQPQNPNANLPNIDQIKKADMPQTLPPAVTSAPVSNPAPVAAIPIAAPLTATAPAPQDQSGLMAKLDQMMSRMDTLEKKIDQKQAVPVQATSSNDVAELKAVVARLEDKVNKLSEQPAPVRTASIPSYNEEMPSKVIVKKSVPKVRKKKITSDENAAWSPAKSASSSYSSLSSKWELRSARPGEAMIGKTGEAGLQTVRVGDTIPGLGQVRAISQMGGSWVVQAGNGSISQ